MPSAAAGTGLSMTRHPTGGCSNPHIAPFVFQRRHWSCTMGPSATPTWSKASRAWTPSSACPSAPPRWSRHGGTQPPRAQCWRDGWTRWWAGCGLPWTSVPRAPRPAASCRSAARRPGAPSALTPSRSWGRSNLMAGSGSTGHEEWATEGSQQESSQRGCGAWTLASHPAGGTLWEWVSPGHRMMEREGQQVKAGSANNLPLANCGWDGSVPALWRSHLFWLILKSYRFLVFPVQWPTPPPDEWFWNFYFEQQNFCLLSTVISGVQGADEIQAALVEAQECKAPSQSSALRSVPWPRVSPTVPLQNPRALQMPVWQALPRPTMGSNFSPTLWFIFLLLPWLRDFCASLGRGPFLMETAALGELWASQWPSLGWAILLSN